MKTLIMILLSIISVQIYAPPSPARPTKEQSYQFTILTNPQFRIYYPLIKAIVYVESRGNDSAYNKKEGAKGRYQIRACRLTEYNNLTGKNYTHNEMYQHEKAEEVFMYYFRGRDFETIARAWCSGEHGTRKASQKYWNLVKSKLAQL